MSGVSAGESMQTLPGELTRSTRDFALFRSGGEDYLLHAPSLQILRVTRNVAESLSAGPDGWKRHGDSIAPEELESQMEASGLRRYESAEDIARFRRGSESKPQDRYLLLNIANSCNLACRYCFADGGELSDGGSSEMNVSAACRAIDAMLLDIGERSGRIGIVFFGGEPLLALKSLESIVEYAEPRLRSRGAPYQFSITTNGLLLTRKVLDLLAAHNFSVVVSLDGPAEIHNRNRPFPNGTGSHTAVLRNLRDAVSRHPALLSVRATLTPEWIELVALDDYLLGLGLDDFGFEIAYCSCAGSSRSWTAEALDRLDHEYGRYAKRLTERMLRGDYRGLAETRQRLHRLHTGRRDIIPCLMSRALVAMTAAGKYYPCQRLAGNGRYEIGSLEAGFDPEAQTALTPRPVFERARCRDCWARYLCAGGCPATAALENGNMNGPDDAICAARFVMWKWTVLIYLSILRANRHDDSAAEIHR